MPIKEFLKKLVPAVQNPFQIAGFESKVNEQLEMALDSLEKAEADPNTSPQELSELTNKVNEAGVQSVLTGLVGNIADKIRERAIMATCDLTPEEQAFLDSGDSADAESDHMVVIDDISSIGSTSSHTVITDAEGMMLDGQEKEHGGQVFGREEKGGAEQVFGREEKEGDGQVLGREEKKGGGQALGSEEKKRDGQAQALGAEHCPSSEKEVYED